MLTTLTLYPLALVVWNHASGGIEAGGPNETSPLRIERFAGQITSAHVGRYQGLPPHVGETEEEEEQVE